jgi:hypothetical protein
MFSRQDLDGLIAIESDPVVSIYQPTHPAGREVRQDPIRFRRLLGQAREALERGGLRRAQADERLAPAARLLDDEEFWRHQAKGLAVFVAPGTCRVLRLPIEPAELVVVGPRVHLTPLLPLIDGHCRFLLLALSTRRARLFEGSDAALVARADIHLPDGIEAVAGETDYQRTRHASPVGRSRTAKRGMAGTTQSFGQAPDEVHKEELIEFLRRVAAALDTTARSRAEPIVLAAQPEIQGHFRTLVDWPTLVEAPLADNPDALDERTLHARARELVAPRIATVHDGDLDRLNALLGSADARASLELGAIVQAARDGRVDTLFIAEGETRQGGTGASLSADETLLDAAAIETLRHRGHVDVMPQDRLPRHRPLAAILRY